MSNNISRLDNDTIKGMLSSLSCEEVDIDSEGIKIIQNFQHKVSSESIKNLEGFKYYKLLTFFINPEKEDARTFTYSLSNLSAEERLPIIKARAKRIAIAKHDSKVINKTIKNNIGLFKYGTCE